MEILQAIADLLSSVKRDWPLVHHITNYVTANDSANIVLALGGSPVMADSTAEVEEMLSQASALVLNTGTLSPARAASMLLAGKKANELSIPVILDPVGLGTTALRNKAVREILENVRLAAIKGNSSEITFLAGKKAGSKGVDALGSVIAEKHIAVNLARSLNCVIGATGPRDIVTDGSRICIIENGNQMLSRVTGTGCMGSSLVGTYAAVTDNYFLSTAAGILTMGIAGDRALKSLKDGEGIGTFKVRLFDAVGSLCGDEIIREGKVHEEAISD